MMAMTVRRTTSAASVKPASERLPAGGCRLAVAGFPVPGIARRTGSQERLELAVWDIVLCLSPGLALHIGDARGLARVGGGGRAGGLIGLHLLVGRVCRHLLPVGGLGDGIDGDLSQIGRNELVEVSRVFL